MKFKGAYIPASIIVAVGLMAGCGQKASNDTPHAVTMKQVENNAPGLKEGIAQENQQNSAASQAYAARAKAAGLGR